MRTALPRHQRFFRRAAPRALRRLKRMGIKLEPFITVREGEREPDPPHDGLPEGMTADFLPASASDEIVAVDRWIGREIVETWFREGKLCFGVRDGARLVAKMWCDLEAFHFPPMYRVLEDDEVYMFAACVSDDYRGRDLGPMMRSACYSALRRRGRTRFYSYTDFFNYPARRFKEKLGARNESVRLHVDLFGKWSKTITLKQYR